MILQSCVVWVLSLIFCACSWARCEGLQGADFALCRGLEIAEWGGDCRTLRTQGLENAFDACVAMSDLAAGGNCFGLEDNPRSFLICSGIYRGLRGEECKREEAYLTSASSEEALCEFGRVIQSSYPAFMERRRNAFVQDLINYQIEILMGTDLESRQNSARNLANRLVKAGFSIPSGASTPTAKQTIPLEHLISYSKNLVTAIENNRELLTGQNKLGADYYPAGTQLGSDLLPSAVYISSENRILVRLETLLIEGEVVEIEPVGEGTLKRFSLSLDYDQATTSMDGLSESQFDDGLRVTGELKPCSSQSNLTDSSRLEVNHARQEAALHEVNVQQNFLGEPGIADPGSANFYQGEEARLILTQKYYPLDFHDFFTRFWEMETWEGRSKEKVRTRFAIEVLEGLSAIHQKGFVHRDIKSQNIFMGFGKGGLPRAFIGDFDTAFKIKGEEFANPGILVGTLPFLSPEYAAAFAGPSEDLESREKVNKDPKTDIWSLGLVLSSLDSLLYMELSEIKHWTDIGGVKSYKDIPTVYEGCFEPNAFPFCLPPIDTYAGVVARMLNPVASERLTASEALDLFRKIEAGQGLASSADLGFSAGPDLFKQVDDLIDDLKASGDFIPYMVQLQDELELALTKEMETF